VRSFALALLPLVVFSLACEQHSAPAPTPSAAVSAPMAASSAAPIVGAQTKSANKLDACPSAVSGAKTALVEVPNGVELLVTAPDAAAQAEVRARALRTVEAARAEPAGAHTGDGTGSGSSGRCPVVLRGTRVTSVDIEGGVRITVLGARPEELDWLRRETRDRLAELERAGGERRVDLCPSTAPGAETVVRAEAAAVVVEVTATTPSAIDMIRTRGKALLEEATRRGAAGDRSGEGKGRGGGLGRCAVVVDGAEVSLTERPDGAAFTLRPRPGTELAELTKLAQDRAATTRKTRP
jgi:hypothetical protein